MKTHSNTLYQQEKAIDNDRRANEAMKAVQNNGQTWHKKAVKQMARVQSREPFKVKKPKIGVARKPDLTEPN